ncbi:MAG: glycosyltransferase family 4 protein [Flavisolibacter sp.]
MPRVLGLVSFRIYPTLMGGQKGVALFYAYLRDHLKVSLALSADNEIGETAGCRKLLFPNRKIYMNLFRLKKLESFMRQEQTDVIIAEHSYTGWIAWLLQKRTGKPFIIHSHNIESKRFRQMHQWWWRVYHLYEGWVHRKADHNFFISQEDLVFAKENFRLDPTRCSVITYGVEPVVIHDKASLRKKLGLDPADTIFLFNGTLDYKPNYDAVLILIGQVAPLLSKKTDRYKIVITGNRAPKELLEKMQSGKNIIYAGYVEDVNEWYQAADLFLNPVVNDTGVKTKLIEAIANHCTSISTRSGASGMMTEVCGNKLVLTDDDDWKQFVDLALQKLKHARENTPADFYVHYGWEALAGKAAATIQSLTRA